MDYSSLFEEYQGFLNDSIEFVNRQKTNNPNDELLKERKQLNELLTKILLGLDTLENNKINVEIKRNKKNMIIAIENVLSQLDKLFSDDKNIILLRYSDSNRESYLPDDRDSHYSITNTYDQGSI